MLAKKLLQEDWVLHSILFSLFSSQFLFFFYILQNCQNFFLYWRL
jgi:hypothetical protein